MKVFTTWPSTCTFHWLGCQWVHHWWSIFTPALTWWPWKVLTLSGGSPHPSWPQNVSWKNNVAFFMAGSFIELMNDLLFKIEWECCWVRDSQLREGTYAFFCPTFSAATFPWERFLSTTCWFFGLPGKPRPEFRSLMWDRCYTIH